MKTMELDRNLARFYVEARTKKGEEYSRSALLGFRNSIERHLNNNGVTVKISKNQLFQNSNKILDAKLRINRRAGKENVQHKPVIEATDLVKIRASPFLSMTTPAGLLRRTLRFSLLVQTWKRGSARSSPRQFQVYARCQWPRVRGHDP